MSAPQSADQRCFWRHKWGKWQDKERLRAVSIFDKSPDAAGRLVIVQERRCEKCNRVALREVMSI